MTAGFDPFDISLTTPGNGARSYARASAATAPRPSAAPSPTRATRTEVGLNLGKFQLNYTSRSLTFDLDGAVRDALRGGPGFAEEMELAAAAQSAYDSSGARASASATSTADRDAAPTATPRRAALAYARAQGLDTPEAAMRSLGDI